MNKPRRAWTSMSDLTKCGDEHCPSRFTCWRYCAPSSQHGQSYADFNRADDALQCADGFLEMARMDKQSDRE